MQATSWYRRSAEQGETEAQAALGYMYLNGIGIKRDFKMAVFWYRKAAQKGDQDSQYGLGYCYEHGLGVKQSKRSADSWYRKFANHDYPEAQIALDQMLTEDASRVGQQLFYGTGKQKNFRKAFPYLLKAAELGDPHCQNIVGLCYTYGRGVAKDLQFALYWFEQGTKGNDKDAIGNLALSYAKGHGVKADPKKAFSLYKRAANLGSPGLSVNWALPILTALGRSRI